MAPAAKTQVQPNSQVFNNAVQNLSRMTKADRNRVLDLLPETVRVAPAFGRELGKALAADQDYDLVWSFVYSLPNIAAQDLDAALDFAKALSKSTVHGFFKGTIEKTLVGVLPRMAKHYPAEIVGLTRDIYESRRYGNTTHEIAGISGNLAMAVAHHPEAKKAVFGLFKEMAQKNAEDASKFIPGLSIMHQVDAAEAQAMLDIITGKLKKTNAKTSDAQQGAQYELKKALIGSLGDIAKIDPEKAFSLFDSFIADINSKDRNKRSFASDAAGNLGIIAQYNPERAFAVLEKIKDNKKLSYSLMDDPVVEALVKFDAKRILKLVEEFLNEDPDRYGRGTPDLIVALSKAKTQSADYRGRVFAIAETLLANTKDDYTVQMFSERLDKVNGLKPEQKEKLGSMAFNHATTAKAPNSSTADQIKERITVITNKPAEEARKPVAAAFAQIGLKL